MTREEAYRLAMRACEETWNEKTCKRIKEALEPFMNKPCISEGVCHDSAVQMLDKAIYRQYAIDTFNRWAEFKDYTHVERHILHAVVDELRAMPSISEQPDEWTPILKDLYDGMAERGNHDGME